MHRVALLPRGTLFSAVRIPGRLVLALTRMDAVEPASAQGSQIRSPAAVGSTP